MRRRQRAEPVARTRQRRRGLQRSEWPSQSGLAAVVAGLLLLAVLFVFGRTVSHGFVNYDDALFVSENQHVAYGLTTEGVRWAFTTNRGCMWGPITWLSHALDCQLYGLKPWGHHLTNLLLHAATTVLLFWVLWQATGDFGRALVAAVFAVHPLRVESVAWIAERKGLLSGLFWMLTLAAYIRFVRRPFSPAAYLSMTAFFALGLMSKPVLVTLPFVMLLLDYWPLGRFSSATGPGSVGLRRLIVEKAPLFLLSAAVCFAAPFTQGKAVASVNVLPMSARISNALVSYVVYAEKMFWPRDLAVLYPYASDRLPGAAVAVAFLALAGVSVVAIAYRRKVPYLFVGWFWYLGTLVPMIGLAQVGTFARADRYTYVTQIGLYLALAWGVWRLVALRPRCRSACGVAATLIVACLMYCAWRQTSYWRRFRNALAAGLGLHVVERRRPQ